MLLAFAFILISGVLFFNVFEVKSEKNEVVSTTIETTKYIVTSTEVQTTETTSQNTQSNSNLININTATEEELQKLPGIGKTKAHSIVEFRESNGPFPTVKSITNVPGIGEKTLEKIIDNITV